MPAPPACADCPPSTSTSTASSLPSSHAPQPGSSSSAPPPQPQQHDVLDPATFVPPALGEGHDREEVPRVIIEFCDRCRWLHRAVWTQTELFLTFPPAVDSSSPPGMRAITLVPRNSPETGGRFRVWLRPSAPPSADTPGKGKERWNGWELVWDRKIEGGFPELKHLKQRIRNIISPAQDLGHSDKPVNAKAPTTAAAAAPAPPVPAPDDNLDATSTPSGSDPSTTSARAAAAEGAPDVEERKPGQLLASDFAPSFRCG
ncbi:hypothetical protein JCM3775_006328 [Rhodotorula graminis]